MKKHLIALAFLPLLALAETGPCPDKGCSIPSDAFDPTLNNSQINSSTVSPTVVMPVNNTQMMGQGQSYSTIGSVSCAQSSVNVGTYTNKQGFGGKSIDNVGVFAGITIPLGGESCDEVQQTIVEVQQINLQTSKMDNFAKLFKSCLDARNMGFDINALARLEPALAKCPDILAAYTPKQAPQPQQVVVVKEVIKEVPAKQVTKTLVGYSTYEIWLGNYSDCSSCGQSLQGFVSTLPAEFKKELKLVPFAVSKREQLFAIYLKRHFTSRDEAVAFVEQKVYPLAIPADVRGVKGTEIYR